MKNIFLVFVFSSLLFPQQLKSSPDTLKKLEKVVQETTNTDTSLSEEPTRIEIVNVPETVWWESTILIGFGGVILGWLLGLVSQKKLFVQQSNYTKKEKWLNDFINLTADFSTISFYYRKEIIKRLRDSTESKEQIGSISKETFFSLTRELSIISLKMNLLLNSNVSDEERLNHLLREYKAIMRKDIEKITDIESMENDSNELAKKITIQLEIIIAKKRKELEKM